MIDTGTRRADDPAASRALDVQLDALRAAGAEVVEVDGVGEEQLASALSILADVGVTGELILLAVASASPRPPLEGLSRVTVWHAGRCDPSLHAILESQLQRRSQRRVPDIDCDPLWTVRLPEEEGAALLAESLGALSNGRAGVRATRGDDAGHSPPPFLVSGAYDQEDRLLPGPVWTAVDLPEQADHPGPERLVDLRSGVLWQRPVGGVGSGSLRFVSAANPHVVGLRLEAGGADLAGQPALRPPDGGCGYSAKYVEGVEVASTGVTGPGSGGGSRIVVAARQRATALGGAVESLERLAFWEAHGGGSHPPADVTAGLAAAEKVGFDGLLSAHRAAWADRWKQAGVWIEGSPADELAARFAVFHLLGAAADGGESAVGPRGLTGDAYAGHVFWDADVFVLPALAAIRPAAARSMLQYRINRLPAARRRASAAGRRGARFPWESARDGSDVTPPWVRDRTGRMVAIRTGRHEIHIVADVAWSACLYAEWTADDQFLEVGRGRDLLIETARYWASRIRLDRSGRGHLYGVMGPDEYHQVVDDNAFTNVMARWNLRKAAGLFDSGDRLDSSVPDHAGISEEARAWTALASGLVDGWDPQQMIYEQFAGYYELERLMVRDIAEPPVAADLVIPPERVAGSQLIKQADTLMLYHMIPDDVPPGSLGATLDYYGPRTAHGSSLSPAIHASLLARAGRADEALGMFRLAARLDLDDVTRTTSRGLHLATMGGVWQALAYGFLGLRCESGRLHIDPHLPTEWSALRLRFSFRATSVEVRADRRRVDMICDSPLEVVVCSAGAVTVEPPGRTWTLPLGGDGSVGRDV